MYRSSMINALVHSVFAHAVQSQEGQAGGGVRDVEANPLASPINAQISTKLVDVTEVAFHFRKDKDLEEKNPALKGKTKRPTFKAPLPLLTKAGLLAALTADDKSTQLALDQCNEAIINRARGMINDAVESDSFNAEEGKWNKELSAKDLDMEKLSFLAIANMPKSERGAGIPKEAFAAFVADYKETMQKKEAIEQFQDKKARSPEVLDKHGVILAGKFNQVRSRKDVIGQMLGFLDIWVQVTENLDDHLAVYEHLTQKGKVLMEGESFEDL